jgi:hypothetical protein
MILWIDGTFRIPESVRRARVRVIYEKIKKKCKHVIGHKKMHDLIKTKVLG